MRNIALSFIASILLCSPVSADPEKGQVLTGKDTADNIEVRLVAATIDHTRGQFLHAKFVPVKGENKEIEVRFPGHTLTTHETTIMDIIYSTTGVLEFRRQPHAQNIKDAGKDTEWSEASLNVVFSIPKDLRATGNDFSHWYLVSIKVPDNDNAAQPKQKGFGFPNLPPIPTANPTNRSEKEFRVPTQLRVSRSGKYVGVEAVPGALESVKVTVGKDMVTGLRYEVSVYRGGKLVLSGPGGMQGGPGPYTHIAATVGEVGSKDFPSGEKYQAKLRLALFETDIPPQHFWVPETGRYKVLWVKTLTLDVEAPADRLPVGRWNVEFAKGAKEVCEVRKNRTASVTEPLRTSTGKAEVKDGSVVIIYEDDRVERWTPVGKRMVVEHWYPAAQFPSGTPVLGIATRKSKVTAAAKGEEPSIVFDNHPEVGVPREALAQKLKLTAQEELLAAKEYPVKLHTLTDGTIKTVRIRYFKKETWKSEKEVGEYVAGFLSNKSSAVYGWQVWSQVVGVPEIECLVDFTDEYRKKLLAENKACREGRLLIWKTEACFRDATGRWFFVDAFDHFHSSHPKGNRENAKGTKSKCSLPRRSAGAADKRERNSATPQQRLSLEYRAASPAWGEPMCFGTWKHLEGVASCVS